jgi:ribosomal protein S6--L-glutamate ligase
MSTRLSYFKDFVLNEAKKSSTSKPKIKVVLLSNVSEESKTVPSIKAECEKRGLKFSVIEIDKAKLVRDSSGETYTISDSKSKMKIDSEDTVILTRRGVVASTYTRDLVEQLEDANFFVVNTLESILACENKYVTSKILMDAGIPVPRMALIDNVDSIDEAVKSIGGQFPVVLKMLSGSQGIGVSIVDSLASLKSVMQTIWKANSNVELLIQEKIDSDYDLRIHVLTRKFNSPTPDETDSVLLGYMRRNRVKKDFRTNYSLGGSVEKTKVTPEQERIAIESAKAIGCNWCGVDIIVDKKTKKNYVLEVNASPGTEGLKKATGVDVVKDIIDFISDKQNWNRSRRVVGFREVVTVPGIGDFVAKFDTGNGSLSCSMTYDEAVLSDDRKTVNWELNGKKYNSKVIGFSNAEVGKHVQERPIIEFDIIFGGKTYKDVHISLVNRVDKSTKFLANRKFMERIGCSVSPFKTFIVTSFSEEYNPVECKGVKYGGIKFEK